jgi:putative aldouronate transport system substrate-binding protein
MFKKSMPRRDFLKLASLATGGVVLAACSPATTAAPATAPTEAAKPADPTATTTPKAEDPTAAPAATDTAIPEPTATPAPTELPAVELVWYLVSGGEPTDLATVEAAVNDYLQPRINATLKMVHADWGSYGDKISLVHSSGEAVDLEFTAPWTNNFAAAVSNGALLPLDDLLMTHAPGLYASMQPSVWNAARMGGKLYGVINQQIFPKHFGVGVRQDLAEKYGLDVAALTGYNDPALFDFMQKVKDGGDTKYVSDGPWYEPTFLGYDPLGPAVVKVDDGAATAVTFGATPEFREHALTVKAWNDAGFLSRDIPDVDAAMKAGEMALFLTRTVNPGADIVFKQKYERELVSKVMHNVFINTDGVIATMHGINANSKNAERAMQLLELVNTDVAFYNLLCYGVEGKHWNWKDQSQLLIEQVADSGYNPGINWEFGNTFNGYYNDPTQVGLLEIHRQVNATATPSPVLGFAFDRTPVETELAAIQQIIDPLNAEIYAGTAADTDAAIAALLEALDNAGQPAVLMRSTNRSARGRRPSVDHLLTPIVRHQWEASGKGLVLSTFFIGL